MHFELIDQFDNERCVRVCDSVKDQSIPKSLFIDSLCVYLYTVRF